MIALSREHGYTPELLISTHKINELQPFKAVELLSKAIPNIAGKTVAILGLAFKPETTDMREAVSIKIIEELIRLGAKIRAHDPLANNEAKRILGDKIRFCQTIEECLDGSNACVVVTEWKQFQKLSPSLMKKHMKETILFDGRLYLRNRLGNRNAGLG